MKQVAHGDYLLVEVPSMAFGFMTNNYSTESEFMYMLDVEDIDDTNKTDESLIVKKLPQGSWQIVGKADECSEEQAIGLVGIGYEYYRSIKWRNFIDNSICDTPTQSLSSLIKSHSMNPETTLILKNAKTTT